MTEFAESADGTRLAWDASGSGPALVIAGGAFNTRQSPAPLVGLLADAFTVVTWDRRGRGDSAGGDSAGAPVTDAERVDREVDDLTAVIAAAGGHAFLYGHSSGAILVLEAAARGVDAGGLAAYEPPFRPFEPGQDPMDGVRRALETGDREAAAKAFLVGTGMVNTEYVTQAPFWLGMVALAPTLLQDLALTGDGVIPSELAGITVPTLVLDGQASPPWASAAAVGLAGLIPNSTRVTVEGQDHNVDPAALAPILRDFFGGVPSH